MPIEQKHITAIRNGFAKMQSRQDLLHLLNEAKRLVYNTNERDEYVPENTPADNDKQQMEGDPALPELDYALEQGFSFFQRENGEDEAKEKHIEKVSEEWKEPSENEQKHRVAAGGKTLLEMIRETKRARQAQDDLDTDHQAKRPMVTATDVKITSGSEVEKIQINNLAEKNVPKSGESRQKAFYLFELKQLTWYGNPKLCPNRYQTFIVKKKSGKERIIHAPVPGLKAIQKALAFILQCVFEPHRAATGFVRGKSIVDNARLHEGSNYVYNLDLKDFFHSIDQARVWKCLQLDPFNLVDTKFPTEEEWIKSIRTDVRSFTTEFGETISYKITNGDVQLVNDKKGNFRKYKNRLTGQIQKPKVKSTFFMSGKRISLDTKEGLEGFAAAFGRLLNGNGEDESSIEEKLKKAEVTEDEHRQSLERIRNYGDEVNNIISADASKYIFSDENKAKLNSSYTSPLSIANMIASLCCTELQVERLDGEGTWVKVKRNVLPQGAPTSPVVTNIICYKLDRRLSGLAKRFGLKYSRYADDITFSSMHNVYQQDSDFIKELRRIISDQGFHINESKTRLQKDGYRQEVTGLLVNEKANVEKRYIKQIRMWLYYWERYGYQRANSFFLEQYVADKGHVKKGKPNMVNVIAGKLEYLKMVKGAENEMYLNLRSRFAKIFDVKAPIDALLEIWEREGIENAMNRYYNENKY